MQILVVSGFLGAGKTTFIGELARHAPGRMAVLENEYAAAGIDGDILRGEGQPVNVWEMAEGCICCSMKKELAASVLTIANSLDPEYLVIEPTGVGMLSAVIANLQKITYARISLLAPLVIVDGQSLCRYLSEYPEIYRDQIACARTIIPSRLEQAGSDERAWLLGQLRALNPQAEILTGPYREMPPAFWQQLFRRQYDGTVLPPPAAPALPESLSLKGVSLDCPERLILLLEGLLRGEYGNIFRAKGLVQAGGVALRFDLADGRYCLSGAKQASGRAVFIGSDINRQKISALFARRVKVQRVKRAPCPAPARRPR